MEANCEQSENILYFTLEPVYLLIQFRFFDLFVAMCNHVDDIVDMLAFLLSSPQP